MNSIVPLATNLEAVLCLQSLSLFAHTNSVLSLDRVSVRVGFIFVSFPESTYVCVCGCACTHAGVCMHALLYVCMHVCIYIYIYVCVCVHVRVWVCAHAHTCVCTQHFHCQIWILPVMGLLSHVHTVCESFQYYCVVPVPFHDLRYCTSYYHLY